MSQYNEEEAVQNGVTTAATTGNPWLTAASFAAPILGGIFGGSQANAERDRADRMRELALAQYAGLNAPSLEDQRLALEQYYSTGAYNPMMEDLVNLGPSAMEGIALDPQLRQRQMQALEQMNQLATQGTTPADHAIMELARRNAAGEAEAKQQQILQSMQSRGMGGSGAELIARLQGGQSSADRLQQAGLEEAARRQQARLQATEGLANMSSQIRGQEFGEQAQIKAATDAVNRFNAANAQGINTRNTSNVNTGRMYNNQTQQNLANQNVNIRNQQQQYNKGLYQNQFNNQLNLANAKAGVYTGNAAAQDQRAGQTASMWSGIGQGVGTMIGAANNGPQYMYDPYTGKPYGSK